MFLKIQTLHRFFLLGLLCFVGCNSDENKTSEVSDDLLFQPPPENFSTKQPSIQEFPHQWTYQIWKGKRGDKVPQDYPREPTHIEDLTRSELKIPTAPPAHPVSFAPSPHLSGAPVQIIGGSARTVALAQQHGSPRILKPTVAQPQIIPAPLINPFHRQHSPQQAALMSPARPTGLLPAPPLRPLGLYYLAGLSEEELKSYDIAFLNLVCLENMPEFDRNKITKALEKLDEWALRVAYETERNLYQFLQNPQKYQGMEGYFRMLVLVTVVQQDIGAVYNPHRDSPLDSPQSNNEFFSDPMDVFIHGFTDREPPMGTCSSFPVLYTAIAQRLRYPVFLVTAKEHLFCRWDFGSEKFNIEGTSRGMNSHPDSYYMKWPRPMTVPDAIENHHLRSMTAKEAFSLFLSIRGSCLEHGQNNRRAAWEAFKLASLQSPHVKNYATAESVLRP